MWETREPYPRRDSGTMVDDALTISLAEGAYGAGGDSQDELATKLRKLLIVDDQVGITKAMNLVATGCGLDVRTLNNPRRALDVFIAYQPDIVILDMVMPEKDGIDVLNEILTTGIPTHVIITSGFGTAYLRLAESVAKFHGATRISTLRKPFRRDDLIEALEKASAT